MHTWLITNGECTSFQKFELKGGVILSLISWSWPLPVGGVGLNLRSLTSLIRGPNGPRRVAPHVDRHLRRRGARQALDGITIAHGGVVPHIHSALLPKKTGAVFLVPFKKE